MTGHDSSHNKSAETIALLALAAFSTSYNLPVYLHYNATCIIVYLHYNGTFRRAYLRMWRCQSASVSDSDPVASTRAATLAVIPRDRAASDEESSRRQQTLGRVSEASKEMSLSTGKDRSSTRAATPRVTSTHFNTTQPDASDGQRY